VARDIDRKLRLTAALLGVVARKDLAAAFRQANPNTSFDVGRADKWLQGRARPRELAVYEDWSKVLDLDRPGRWIADCDTESFLDEICTRHGRDREELRRQVESFGNAASRQGHGLSLAGTYACYSHAWSPYFRGRLIRGELSVAAVPGPQRLAATYTELLPTGTLRLQGPIALDSRSLRLEVSDIERAGQRLDFCLFPPSPPVSVLGGFMVGATVIGPDAQPSVSRIAMIRLPAAPARQPAADAYLPAAASIAEDLAALGLPVEDPVAVDRCLAAFLGSSSGGGLDQVPLSGYRALVDLFDRAWLGVHAEEPANPARYARTGAHQVETNVVTVTGRPPVTSRE
jgi:hypothetical protein